MKRSYSCSSINTPRKRLASDNIKADLTYNALKEHDKITQTLPPFALFHMAPEERSSGLSDVPTLPPPSTRSSNRSRSNSPSRPSDAQYRGGHLRRANIFVDDELPTSISAYVYKEVFHSLMCHDDLHLTTEKLWAKSKELVKKPSGEAEWTEALHTAIEDLAAEGLEIVRNREWRADLKPPVHNPQRIIPQKRNQQNDYNSQDIESAVASPVIPMFKLKDPRPDICVGLSDESLANDLVPGKGRGIARSFLLDLQDTSSLISDPHVTPLGLRFPFLIVEAKSGATGGNLYQAQNQAAVSGSAALQILKNMSYLQSAPNMGQGGQEDIEFSNQPELSIATLPELIFSITTEGPIHELWLHFRRSGQDFCMVCIGAWRITLKDDLVNLIRHLFAVLKWGNGKFRDTIIRALLLL